MTYYEIFQQGPAVYIPLILLSLAITLLGYSAFPIVFAIARKKPITKKKYNIICYCVNFFVAILFTVLDEKFSVGPYLLWTFVFSSIGLKNLKKRQFLEGVKPSENEVTCEQNGINDTVVKDKIVEDTELTKTQTKAKKEKKSKIKYCSQCGSLIDSETKVCSGCGKKYFKGLKFTKTTAIIIVLSLALLVSFVVIGILLSREWTDENETSSNLQNQDYYVDDSGNVLSFEEWLEENEVEPAVTWLSDYRFLYYDDSSNYVLLFKLSDENEKAISTSGNVDIRIVNDENTTVYDKTKQFTKKNFEYWTYDETEEMHVAAIYIEPSEIKLGGIEYGKVYFTVYGDDYSFEEVFTTTVDLPIVDSSKTESIVVTQPSYNSNNHSYAYTCLNSYCNNKVVKIGAYCSEHKCENGDCSYERKANSKYCYSCSCGASGCLNAEIPNGQYCLEHTCENDSCGYEREPNSKYCSICSCGVAGCLNVKMINGYYCVEHTCTESTCKSSKSLDKNYCTYHELYATM